MVCCFINIIYTITKKIIKTSKKIYINSGLAYLRPSVHRLE